MPKTNLYGDLWWRFNRYEIRDGFIVPSSNARLEKYKPWESYAPVQGKGSVVRPYGSLIELAKHFEGRVVRNLTTEEESLILNWCNANGLLGLLLHQAEVVLQPSEEPGFWHHYYKTPRGWTREELFRFHRDDPPARGMLVRRLGTFNWHREPLSTTWELFFPDVLEADRESHLYPLPTSREFWQSYAEPVGVFLDAAIKLSRTITDLSRIRLTARTSDIDKRLWAHADAVLQSLTYSTTPVLYPSRSRSGYSFGWACHSLLATLAMMASLDLAQARVLSCRRCGQVFVSQAKQARYCSVRCRNTEQMKRYRKAKEKADQGANRNGKAKTRKR